MTTFNPHTDTHAIEKYQFLEHFLPHPVTRQRAKLLQHKALATYAFVLVFFMILFQLLPKVAPGILGYASNIEVGDLLAGTNQIRNENGLKTLKMNSALSEAARRKAEHMFENNYWAHVAPDGTTPWDFILGANYDYTYAGENLAKNFNDSDAVVEAWFNSESHRENLLSSNYDEIGFAVVNGVLDGYETTLVVQMFGRSRAPAQQAEVPVEPVAAPVPLPQETAVPISEPVELALAPTSQPEVLPAIDVTTAYRSITLLVVVFLVTLLSLDLWYTKRKGIPKLSGNAFAHIIFLVITVVGVWFALTPGRVL
jgi:uncharacterized protein YkwD